MQLNKLIEKLAGFEANGAPFISIYLDARPHDNGRETYKVWLKKEIAEARGEFAEDSDEAKTFDSSIERIQSFLDSDADATANGIAVFAALAAKLGLLSPR